MVIVCPPQLAKITYKGDYIKNEKRCDLFDERYDDLFMFTWNDYMKMKQNREKIFVQRKKKQSFTILKRKQK